MLNMTDLARDADIAVNTAKSWLSILQASGVIFIFEVLKKFKMPIGPGGLICLVQDTFPLTEQHQAIPVTAL